MKSHTYYDILGVSRDATLDEITTAKKCTGESISSRCKCT